ncbi:hypothetical protein N9H57_06465 [Flavobacteriaceae bacterium]|nr:hypothetical protein [Flavobacteriaceae bacterium]MDB3862842.1 hypothetical protein [Flavobacteriaceae bacterium]
MKVHKSYATQILRERIDIFNYLKKKNIIRVEKQHDVALKQRIKTSKRSVKAELNTAKNHDYTFAHNEVPFAYKMERISGFND